MSRVLMIDNPALFRLLDASFVHRAGWEILTAQDAAGILDKARAQTPDVILLDASIPGFDAPACVLALKSEDAMRSLAVLVLAGPDAAGACETAGADATLGHPVLAPALEAALCALGGVAARAGRRRRAPLPARVGTADGVVRGRLKDISRSGVFLALTRPLPLRSPIELVLRLPVPGGPFEVQARGVVVRQVEDRPGSDQIAGIGVRFTGVDATSESIIDRFVDLDAGAPEVEPGAGDEEMQ
jgi:CheY-like chemotaxis protein